MQLMKMSNNFIMFCSFSCLLVMGKEEKIFFKETYLKISDLCNPVEICHHRDYISFLGKSLFWSQECKNLDKKNTFSYDSWPFFKRGTSPEKNVIINRNIGRHDFFFVEKGCLCLNKVIFNWTDDGLVFAANEERVYVPNDLLETYYLYCSLREISPGKVEYLLKGQNHQMSWKEKESWDSLTKDVKIETGNYVFDIEKGNYCIAKKEPHWESLFEKEFSWEIPFQMIPGYVAFSFQDFSWNGKYVLIDEGKVIFVNYTVFCSRTAHENKIFIKRINVKREAYLKK